MPAAVYVDCFSGASGDMLLGALIDAGAPLEGLRHGLATLPVGGWSLTVESVDSHGLHGTRAKVQLAERDQPHRGLAEVCRIIDAASGLPEAVKERSTRVFTRLAEVEAQIHATTPDAVEFHEVGAIDAIVDITGVVFAFHLLDIGWQHIACSGLPTGSGWVRSQHGPLPVPAPATLELLRRASAPLRSVPSQTDTGELTTPTGAALLTVLASFQPHSQLASVERIGYGFGTRELAWPNAVRVMLGAAPTGTVLQRDQVVQLETNLDDITPEELGFAMERLLEAGALDVAFSPLQMKKNRPGVLVRVLARPQDGQRLAELLLEHTSALGARVQALERVIARRAEKSVTTPWGSVRVKVKLLGDREIIAPEYEDCARLARAASVPLALVYDAARRSSR